MSRANNLAVGWLHENVINLGANVIRWGLSRQFDTAVADPSVGSIDDDLNIPRQTRAEAVDRRFGNPTAYRNHREKIAQSWLENLQQFSFPDCLGPAHARRLCEESWKRQPDCQLEGMPLDLNTLDIMIRNETHSLLKSGINTDTMPAIDEAMARSLRGSAWEILKDKFVRTIAADLARRDMVGDAATKVDDFTTAISSWDNCMSVAWCKYVRPL
ncbi:hypothetical protein NM208_g16333 [Fusarium decemcellulare]|uniref:Uncharacterized protein n=1 Tax=Fusarium decemcellulare TaxID=57161 RepID=A0ACC1RDV6_9HYPO|nr:hypothetical protein NM208_g16333 [Fusarium decemcellulare]